MGLFFPKEWERSLNLGKTLKGKNCGKGICQRKDGLYSARFVDRLGKRHTKCFVTLPEARNWLADAKYADQHGTIFIPADMTVDTWFEYWSEHIVGDLAPNTRRNYRERYVHNIQPVIGKLQLTAVKPIHCKMVLNAMEADYAGSTIRQTYITMGTLFRSAVMNDLIAKHPMDGVRYTKPVRAVDDIKFLTVEEQEKFLEAARRSHNYAQYALILETGLRTGELIGLTWDAIDWERRTLTVNKTLEFRHKQEVWRAGPPKTQKSYRTIPLTNRACEILQAVWNAREDQKESAVLARSWSTWTAAQARRPSLSCGIWSLSTGAQGNRRKTVPMTPTATSCATRRGSSGSVCTPCGTPTPPAPLSAECSPRCRRSSWATPASRPPWTAMSM